MLCTFCTQDINLITQIGLDMPWPSIGRQSPGKLSKSCASRARRFCSSACEEWQGPRLPPGKPPAAMGSWGRFRVPRLLHWYKQRCYWLYVHICGFMDCQDKSRGFISKKRNSWTLSHLFSLGEDAWRFIKVYEGVSRCQMRVCCSLSPHRPCIYIAESQAPPTWASRFHRSDAQNFPVSTLAIDGLFLAQSISVARLRLTHVVDLRRGSV